MAVKRRKRVTTRPARSVRAGPAGPGRGTKSASRERIVVGLVSGTSADGVDAAIVDIDESSGPVARLLAFDVFPYPPALRRSVLKLFDPESARLDDICHYNFVLGEVFADAIVKLCNKSGISLNSIDLNYE